MDVYGFYFRKQSGGKILVSVPVDGMNKYLNLEFVYNMVGHIWSMTVYDGSTQECLLSNVPLLFGQGKAQNLLRQFGYKGIGSAFVVPYVKEPTTDSPDAETWLEEFRLWWGDESA